MRFLGLFFAIVFSSAYSSTNLVDIKPNGYAVVSANPFATNAGLAILAKGGNAFDAAIAVSAALAVVEPYHSGIGGGGFWLLHSATSKDEVLIDGREVAPSGANKDMFLDPKGQVIPGLSLNGGLAAAIPGEPAALVYMAEHYGRLPLSESLAPAIRLAEEGYSLDPHFIYYLSMPDRLGELQRYPASAAIFLSNNRPYQVGDRLIQADLAKTLKLLAEKGKDGFYKGATAEQLVKGVNESGGRWSLSDLANYQVKIRKPLITNYKGMRVVTTPPPSEGGFILLSSLGILSHFSLNDCHPIDKIHRIVEAMRLSYWQANRFLGDPDFIPIEVSKLLSSDELTRLAEKILPNKIISSASLPPAQPLPAHPSTTQIAVLDSDGNYVSATMTVNYIFGSSVVAAGTGVLLNDQMDDFSSKPGASNVFGIVGSYANAIAPGKRPLSSMAPTFLEFPDRIAIFGTPGGSRIPSMVLLSTLAFKQFANAITMVSIPRFHHQYLPDWIQFEPSAFNPEIQAGLKKMGYQLIELKQYYGDMQAITWDKKQQLITAAADPRGIGAAVAVNNIKQSYGVKF